MNDVEKGKHILSMAKTLKAYQIGDARIATFLYASSFAGRAGLLAAALRHHQGIGQTQLTVLAAEEGFTQPELRGRIVPWLEDAGLCRVRRSGDAITSVDSLVLKYDSILTAVSGLYVAQNPTEEDSACIQILDMASQLPRTDSEVRQAIASRIGEEKAATAMDLAEAYKLVSYRKGKGLAEPVLFSPRLWRRHIDRAAKALSHLDTTERAIVLDLVEQVKQYQGMPEPLLRRDAAANDAEGLLDLAIGVGLVNRTDLQMADGTARAFLTSPHFYEDLADEYSEDMFDRIKIFLDSIRNGQHFGSPASGRILDPELLLRKLVNAGEIGPCTAIGRDYTVSERAGIVTVRRLSPTSQRYYMELVQEDTVSKVLEVVEAGRIEGPHARMTPADIREGTRFRSIEHRRAEVGELPARMEEAERAIIHKLREG